MNENEKEVKSPIDCLFDEENTDPITLYNEKGEEVLFEQIAIIPLEERIFAILKPMKQLEGVGEDEALAFEIVETEEDAETGEHSEYLELVGDIDVIDKVFEVYNKLMDEEEEKQKIDKKNKK
ncbi:MAG: DUF1292 domain-containing protein [Christensenellales bacterium]